MGPCDAQALIEQLRARIAELQQDNATLAAANAEFAGRHVVQLGRIAELEAENQRLRADGESIEKSVFHAAKAIDEFRAMSARDLLRDILQKAVARGGK